MVSLCQVKTVLSASERIMEVRRGEERTLLCSSSYNPSYNSPFK
jgi:hypothetical protein